MAVDEAVLDYDILGEFEQEGRRMVRLLLVAAQKAMVNQVVQAALGAKLEPLGLDLVPFALVRAVGDAGVGMSLEDAGDEAIIDVGAHVTNIVVHAQGTTRFVRILPSGGRDITLAIAHGLKRGEEVEGGPPQEEVRRIATQRAGSFVDEIRSSLEFYTAQAQGARIAKVLITGGGSKLEGFIDLLRERIPVTVDPGGLFQHLRSNLQLSPEALQEAEPVLVVATGLAIAGGNA